MPTSFHSLRASSALSIALALAACRGADSDAPAQDGSAVEASQAGAAADVRKRVLETRLLGKSIGTFAIERAPLSGGGERWTMTMTMTLQLDDPGESAKTIESEEVVDYDAKGELVRSSEVSREQGVEETSEIVREGVRIRVKKTWPSFAEDKTFELPTDARSELAVYRELVAAAEA